MSEHLQWCLICDLAKYIYISRFELRTFFFQTLLRKVEQGLHIRGRLLIATHLDESNYLASQKQGQVNKYDLTAFIRLFQGYERCALFLGRSTIPMHPLDLPTAPHPTFSV
jgi:hypothetical protein